MVKKYSFSEAVAKALAEGRKRQSDFQDVEEAAQEFGQSVVQELSRNYPLPISVLVESQKQDSQVSDCQAPIWGVTAPYPDIYTVSAYAESCKKSIPLVSYQVNSSSCYPCIVQGKAQSFVCSDLNAFRTALAHALEIRAFEINRQIQNLSSQYESSSEYSVE